MRNGVRRFLSVPYAAPPVGMNRFEPPRPVTPWEGERNATEAGATAPHSVPKLSNLDISSSFAPGWLEGPDYLTLNLWRPDDDRENLPVFVYIHGGGFINGSSHLHIIDGSAFARDGIISIAINYRLGLDGFLPVAGVPTNLGIRDQLAALRWIQDNVRSFGGDPGRVTIAGESAGAISVGCLLASPMAMGLFHRAILQSGIGVAREKKISGKATERLERLLQVSPDVEGFKAVSPHALVAAQDRLATALIDLRDANGMDPALGVTKFLPIHGDDVIPEYPRAAAGRPDVDLLICTCREEINVLTVPLHFDRWMFSSLARLILGKFHPRGAEVLKAYGLGRRGNNSGQVFSAAVTDLFLRAPSRMFAEQHHGTAHVLEFDWRSPALRGRYGAAHGNVVPFIFDTLSISTGSDRILGTSPPQPLADRYHGAWTRFVKGDAPDWPAYDARTRAVYSLIRGEVEHETRMAAADFIPG